MTLNPRARALLDRARSGFEPSAEDATHVEHAVLAAIATGGVAKTAKLATSWSAGAKITAVIVVVGAAAIGAALLRPNEPVVVVSPPPAALPIVTATEPRATEPATSASAAPEPTDAPAPHPSTRRVPSALPADEIAGEIALVRSGAGKLRAGDAAGALAAFDAHAAKYPNGALEEERSAGRIEALCALGRAGDARAAEGAFTTRHPASPHALRVQRACAGVF